METARKLDTTNIKHGVALSPSDLEFLRTTVLLKNIDPQLLQTVGEFFEKLHFDRGEPIVLENEAGDHVYFIKSGSVEILKYLPEVKQVQRLALLKPPAHFAEFSVLKRGSKGGSAFAVESCEMYRIRADHFMAMLRQIPEAAHRMAAHIAGIFESSLTKDAIELFHPKMIYITRELATLLPPPIWKKYSALPLSLEQNLLRVAMTDPLQSGFVEALHAANPNLLICTYLINQNDYEVQYKKMLPRLGPQGKFEVNKPLHEQKPNTELLQLLKTSNLFKGFSEEFLKSLVPHFSTMSLKSGEAALAPESDADFLFLVGEGRVELTRVLSGSGVLLSLQTYMPGEHFGEEAMILSKKPSGYALASEPAKVYALSKQVLLPLLRKADFAREIGRCMIEKLQARSAKNFVKYFNSKIEGPLPGMLPISVVTDHKVIDLLEKENEVVIGFVNADQENAYTMAGRYLLDKRIRLELLRESEFKKLLAQLQSQKQIPAQQAQSKAAETKNATQILENLLSIGYQDRASDIHFEPTENSLTVRYRIDGVLKEHHEKVLGAVAKEVISRIKIMSGMDISNHFVPQDGQLKTEVAGTTVIARASSIPTKVGEKIVLRLIRSKNSIIPYNMISPDRRLINILRTVVNTRQGLFLITGPTGSGKSTTLYSLLNELNRVDSNCVTLEDPVEMNIPGISQVEVNEKQGLTFAKALRSVLRQDPDVIMVGEVRDEESAQICFKAAITGHLVLSTLHTNSSLDVTPRLRELGVPATTIAAGLIGVLAQRLVRGVCSDCKYTRPIKIFEANLFREHFQHIQLPDHVVDGKGCAKCKGTGFFDRIPVFEVWKKTPEVKVLLARGGAYEELQSAVKNDGFVSLIEFGLMLALNGLTTVDEVLRCISEE